MNKMNNNGRPDPEIILEAVKLEEAQKNKGRLKIFLGMAAGVGKTYAMLEEAQILRRDGVNVVAAIVDTHGRVETESLIENLICLPKKIIIYRDKEFEELDVDAILALRPSVVLVDELAHNNTPGSKHAKRWQDVLELIDNGIDVYTTLNVQHIESLNDIVRGITEISVRETVPDILIESAHSIQLVDLTPEELLQRLKEGKVYFDDQSRIAAIHFFQIEKLTALREIVLRYVADKIDSELRRMVPMKGGRIEWKTREKFLVAISHSPHTQKLIRTTRRLAAQMNSPWIAAYVDTGRTLEEEDKEQLAKNIALTRDLGAEIVTVYDPDITEGIKRIAYQRGITQIIVGRTPRNLFLDILQGPTLLEKLASECKDVDIHVIRQEKYMAFYNKRRAYWPIHFEYKEYFYVTLSIILMSLLSWNLLALLSYHIVAALFLIGIIFLSLFFKRGPILFAGLLYALIWNYTFIPPMWEFNLTLTEDVLISILYVATAVVVSIVMNQVRIQRELLRKSERNSYVFAEIVRCLNSNLEKDEVFHYIEDRLAKVVEGTYEVAAKNENEGFDLENLKLVAKEKEINSALWAYNNGKKAGWSTETLPMSENLYLPLKGIKEVMGLLIYRPPSKDHMLTIENMNLLYEVCQQLSNYLERHLAFIRSKEHERLKLVEKIHRTILELFSQAFQIPILNIRHSRSKLIEILKTSREPQVVEELNHIETSFDIFIKIMDNMTAMAKLGEGMAPLKRSTHNIKEIIDECCENAKKSSRGHHFQIHIAKNLPPISFDYYLIHILLHNLIINALEHSPDGSNIEIEAVQMNDFLNLSVTNEGKEIPENQLKVIFNIFHKIPDEAKPSLGLGLAVAKTIADLHHAKLKAENIPGKGARFTLSLPIGSIDLE